MAYSSGDEVGWNTSQGRAHGRVQEKRTSEFRFDGQAFTPDRRRPVLHRRVGEDRRAGRAQGVGAEEVLVSLGNIQPPRLLGPEVGTSAAGRTRPGRPSDIHRS